MDNDVIKHRLMQAMSISTRSSLSAQLDLAPDKFAKLADTIYSYSKDIFRKTRAFSLHSNLRHRYMHASRSQSKETAQATTVSSHSHPDNDPKIVAFTCSWLTPPNGVNLGVSGQSLHTTHRTVISRTITRHTGTRIAPLV